MFALRAVAVRFLAWVGGFFFSFSLIILTRYKKPLIAPRYERFYFYEDIVFTFN